MQVRSPVSRGSFSLRFAPFDVVWAFTAPILVLWIRGAQALSADDLTNAAVFCALSFLSAAAAFLVFRLRDGLAHLFSVHDALAVGKAVVLTELLTAFFMFSVARLEGIPRSVLILHALLLAAGLVGVRAVLRMASSDERGTWWHSNAEHVIFLGANKLTALYISFLRSFAPGRYEIVGILDDAPGMSGRSVARVRVL